MGTPAPEILSSYLKKLGHPIKEIRERAFNLLKAKINLGWEFDDQLSGVRELLEALLAWLEDPESSLHKEVLKLLLKIIKTETGNYIVREFGVETILFRLDRIKFKLDEGAMETLNDVVDTLQFLKAVESNENVNVPPLCLGSLRNSEDEESSCSHSKFVANEQTSYETSESDEIVIHKEMKYKSTTYDGIKVLLMPWVNLSTTDSKTVSLMEDALKIVKSIRRSCRFIRDVFLRDFPVDILFNRPKIIQHLLKILDNETGRHRGEALHVLLSITQAVQQRLRQLACLEIVNDVKKITSDQKDREDRINVALGDISEEHNLSPDDQLAALRQMPVPLYVVDTLQMVLSFMTRNVSSENDDKPSRLRKLNICLDLVDCLTELLLDCVSASFWSAQHDCKMKKDIAHKSFVVMRSMGELMMCCRKTYFENTELSQFRAIWLRLLPSSERLLNWARDSVTQPSSLIRALQCAQLDPAVEMLYPQVNQQISLTMQVVSVDEDHKNKYVQMTKLTASMKEAVRFMKNKNCCRSSKQVYQCIKNSLPALEFHLNGPYLDEVMEMLLVKTKDFDLDDSDWSVIRSIALSLMAHNLEWVREKFYERLCEMVRAVVSGDESLQDDNEQRLKLLCDVGILTEICCHGISAESEKLSGSAMEVMLSLLRGRLVLTDECWWRLFASLLPVFPLLHVYAAHDTTLGQGICKSLEVDIAECMGISVAEVTMGWVRLLFVRCPSVNLDAALALCRLMDDERFLPPKETLRADVLLNALTSIERHEFNISSASTTSSHPQIINLKQVLEVLKQDLVLDEHGSDFVKASGCRPTLEPSLRRSTLQQLAVLMQEHELHATFIDNNGLKIVLAILRISMLVDDYLAFPDCAISCVSVLNSVSFSCRHTLAKVPGLALLLLRVILVFPADTSAVQMCAQLLAMMSWAGFALQELDALHRRVPALPYCITVKTKLPFVVDSYWKTSPNKERSVVEWLKSDEQFLSCLRVRWWSVYAEGGRALRGGALPPAPPPHLPSHAERAALQNACPTFAAMKALLGLENATSHHSVNEALNLLVCYTPLVSRSSINPAEFSALPWRNMSRFLTAPPASLRDTALLVAVLHFILVYMESLPSTENTMSWITSSFLGSDVTIISLLGKTELYPQQTTQEQVETIQLKIYIVKVVLRCVMLLEWSETYNGTHVESLLKILLACLERTDLKHFHMLGYVNELVRCIRYTLNSRYCKLSEATLVNCIKVLTFSLRGVASGSGCKGQACKLDVTISILAVLKKLHDDCIPVQRWSEYFSGSVVSSLVECTCSARAEMRAAALYVMNALAHHAQFIPHLVQAIEEDSLCDFVCGIFCDVKEANVVRTAAACLIGAITARASPHSDVLQSDVLNKFNDHQFLEACIDILINFCNKSNVQYSIEPNLPMSILERRSELEVRAKKCGDVHITPSGLFYGRRPPTVQLVTALADIVHNVSQFPKWCAHAWHERGLYRLLFRCASISHDKPFEAYSARAAVCRALISMMPHKFIRTTLSSTKDCLYNLLATVAVTEEDRSTSEYEWAQAQMLVLLGCLVEEKAAAETVWEALQNTLAEPFLHALLHAIDSDSTEQQEAGLFCLAQLAQTASQKKTDDNSRTQLLDSIKSPYEKSDSERKGAGDNVRDCDPDYMVEELCRVLLQLFEKLVVDEDFWRQEESWSSVCSCLASVLSASVRARSYCVHRSLPRALVATIRTIRDKRTLQLDDNAKNNPMLRILYWLLTVADCQMLECAAAKEAIADENIALSLNRLWPWCMLTEQLREAVVHFLLTFCNGCPKAWGSMAVCVAGRNLTMEVCALTLRETALQSRPRPDALLLLCLRILKAVMPHHQCRSVILKSEVLSGVFRSRVREREGGGGAAGVWWARVWGAAARWPDGAAAALALRPCPVARSLRPLLLPALTYFAAHRRSHLLQAGDLLDLLSTSLISGDVVEVVSAARAVWTLAANNHRAKLMLRSVGMHSSIQTAIQRMQRLQHDESARRALQMLIYVNSILQAL